MLDGARWYVLVRMHFLYSIQISTNNEYSCKFWRTQLFSVGFESKLKIISKKREKSDNKSFTHFWGRNNKKIEMIGITETIGYT